MSTVVGSQVVSLARLAARRLDSAAKGNPHSLGHLDYQRPTSTPPYYYLRCHETNNGASVALRLERYGGTRPRFGPALTPLQDRTSSRMHHRPMRIISVC